jgi:hypothetical protein
VRAPVTWKPIRFRACSQTGLRFEPRACGNPFGRQYQPTKEGVVEMAALLLLLLILALFGGLGFAVHALWFVLIAAVILWAIAFFMGALGGGRRHGTS